MAGFSELSKKRLHWTFAFGRGGEVSFDPLRKEGQHRERAKAAKAFRDISTRDRQRDSGSEEKAR